MKYAVNGLIRYCLEPIKEMSVPMKTIRLLLSAAVVITAGLLSAGRAASQTIPTTIVLANPTNGQSFVAPASIYVHAQFTDSNLVKYVQYYSGASTIGLATNGTGVVQTNLTQGNSLYLTWSNVTAGTYSLSAVAHDSAGLTLTSAPVTISVTNALVIPSVGIYSPANGARFLPGTNVMLYARAVEGSTTGAVASVQFFANSVSLGVVSNNAQALFTNISSVPLFPLLWSNVPAGSYSLTARATDLSGNAAVSSAVSITVATNSTSPATNIPFVLNYASPTNGQRLAATNLLILRTAATDSNVIRTVQFFANGGSVGLATNAGNLLLTNLTQSSPFYLLWTNPPVGTNVLTALATDSLGITATSGVVTVTLTNLPVITVRPSVYIYSPTNGTKFYTPVSPTIYVRAAESTGTVATIQVFANSLSLGVVSNSAQAVFTNISSEPLFPLLWSNAPVGSYSLTALATDINGYSATSAVTSITISTVTNPPPTNVPFALSYTSPTNGQKFASTNVLTLRVAVTDSNAVRTVQFFDNGGSLGIVTNTSGSPATNTGTGTPFYFTWSNPPAGTNVLTALATDSLGNTASAAAVTITVTNPPVTVLHPSVYIYSPVNNSTSTAPANLNLYARAVETGGGIASVQFFANGLSVGTVTGVSPAVYTNISSEPLYLLPWSNVPAGKYALTALATDTNGNTATSSVVNISVVAPPIIPFNVSFWYPTNGQLFVTPATVGVHAMVTDSNVVRTMSYFANGSLIGTVSNSTGAVLTNTTAGNSFFLAWSNVTAGTYALTALALDSAGNTATSAPVTIFVLTNLPPAVSIYATDPVAVQGTNAITGYSPGTSVTNYVTGTNTATFVVHRSSTTNVDLTVDYSVGGSAINGYDYVTLPGSVVIPAGKSYALVTVWPLPDVDTNYTYYDTVILTVLPPANTVASAPPLPPAYTVGSPASAGALILEADYLPLSGAMINSMADSTLHISLPATNGLNFTLETSTDMINWTPVITNTVLKGSANFVDPNGTAAPNLYYRIVGSPAPASY